MKDLKTLMDACPNVQVVRVGVPAGPRPLHEIAREIEREWGKVGKGVSPYARPYLDAMKQLEKITDNYFADDAKTVVIYFLSNATTWRGEAAKRIKAELKKVAGIK